MIENFRLWTDALMQNTVYVKILKFKDITGNIFRFEGKEIPLLVLLFLLIANISILLNISYLRQILGLSLLLIFPGASLIYLFRLNRLDIANRIVLVVGLSTSFIMFFGFLLNQICLMLGYTHPLSTNILAVAISLSLLMLFLCAYLSNNKAFSSRPISIHISNTEKIMLILLLLIFQLVLIGTQRLTIYSDNLVLLIVTIAIFVLIIIILSKKDGFPTSIYSMAIVGISFSLLTIFWLRSDHVLGHDIHTEYYHYSMTLLNAHWSILEKSTLDSCLSISLLPTIFQSILNVKQDEQFFKGLFVLICSFTPLIVYLVSRIYLQDGYAFLAALFFAFQADYIISAGSARTNMCLFFIALYTMVIFHNKIPLMQQRILSIIFALSIIFSHYTSTYMFFSLLLFTCIVTQVLNRYIQAKDISLASTILFLVLIFIWYGLLIDAPFNIGVRFIEITVTNMQNMFSEEAKSPQVALLYGSGMRSKPLLSWINWFNHWVSFILIGIGVSISLIKHKSFVETGNPMTPISLMLKNKLEIRYLLLSIACGLILIATIILPTVSVNYELGRTFVLTSLFLGTFFVLGGSIIASYLKINPYIILSSILFVSFMFTIGTIPELSGIHNSLIISPNPPSGDFEFVHESEIHAIHWLSYNRDFNAKICAGDGYGKAKLISSGRISPQLIDKDAFSSGKSINGYLFFDYDNIKNRKLEISIMKGGIYNLSECDNVLSDMHKLYVNGGACIWKEN